jgi:hypothetical protein
MVKPFPSPVTRRRAIERPRLSDCGSGPPKFQELIVATGESWENVSSFPRHAASRNSLADPLLKSGVRSPRMTSSQKKQRARQQLVPWQPVQNRPIRAQISPPDGWFHSDHGRAWGGKCGGAKEIRRRSRRAGELSAKDGARNSAQQIWSAV